MMRDEKIIRKCRDGLRWFMKWTGAPSPGLEREAYLILDSWLEALDWALGEDDEVTEGHWTPLKLKFDSKGKLSHILTEVLDDKLPKMPNDKKALLIAAMVEKLVEDEEE